MNFPMDNPVYSALYWLLNTPGVGGITFVLLATFTLTICSRALIWITQGAQSPETETYAYPTPALLHNEEQEGTL